MWNDIQRTNAWAPCASRLLAAAVQLRVSATHPDPRGLMIALSDALARCDDLAPADPAAAPGRSCVRLLVCRRLDESIAATPWGAAVAADESLERRFGRGITDAQVVEHIDEWLVAGGRVDVESMALLHAAMSLAPQRDDPPARSMEEARRRLARALQVPSASDAAVGTSAVSSSVVPSVRRLRDVAPFWVLAAVGSVAMMLLFVALRISINADSDPVFASLRAVDVSAADRPASSPALSPAVAAALAPRLATFLKQDIDAGLVLVDDLPDKSVVTIRSDSFFEPGSAVIADPERMFPLMGRIAAGLNAVPGHALVAGHTDTRHDHSVLYPSNWHLSQDRANVVTSLLAESVDPQRLLAQGRADSEPVGDNSTAQGRSDNRRVDITLVVSQPS